MSGDLKKVLERINEVLLILAKESFRKGETDLRRYIEETQNIIRESFE